MRRLLTGSSLSISSSHILAALLFYFFNLSVTQLVYSLSLPTEMRLEMSKKGTVVDTVDYKKLTEDFYNYRDSQDSLNAYQTASKCLRIAKSRSDTLNMLLGYKLHYKYYHFFNHLNTALTYSDSLIMLSKDKKYFKFPTEGYLFKGGVTYDQLKYEEALVYYMKGLEYAEKKLDTNNIIALNQAISVLKNNLGKEVEAIEGFKNNLSLLMDRDLNNRGVRSLYIRTLFEIGNGYNVLHQSDSAEIYIDRGIDESLQRDPHYNYLELLGSKGTIYFDRQQYQKAIKIFHQTLKLIERKSSNNIELVLYKYIGDAHIALEQYHDSTIYYYRKIYTSLNSESYRPMFRDPMTRLFKHYERTGQLQLQLDVMQKLIYLDSISDYELWNLNHTIDTTYNQQLLVKEKNALLEKVNKSNTFKIYLYSIILSCIILLSIIIYYGRKRPIQSSNNNEQKSLNKENASGVKMEIELQPSIVEEILRKLDEFENSAGFLRKELKMSNMATFLNTNSTYLSKVINKEKGKNFATYVNDLRIEYCLNLLISETKYRSYTLNALAREVGFKNAQSFSSAFLRLKGVKPINFIENLKNDKRFKIN